MTLLAKCNWRVVRLLQCAAFGLRAIAHRLVLQTEPFVDDLAECHGDVRVRAMMMSCCELRFGVASGSGIYCDTLSVSQYDSKVRSHIA